MGCVDGVHAEGWGLVSLDNVALYSGGKDSLAMLLLAYERGVVFDEILYVDVGPWMWEVWSA